MKIFPHIAKGVVRAGLAVAAGLILSGQASAQGLKPATFTAATPGWAAMTNASLDQSDYLDFSADGPEVRVWDLSAPSGQPTPSKWPLTPFTPSSGTSASDKTYLWTGQNLGQVFGIAIDTRPTGPYIYVTSTAIYGSTVNGTISGCLPASDCYDGLADLSAPGALDNAAFKPNVAGIFATDAKGAAIPGAIWRLSLKSDLAPTTPAPAGAIVDPHGTYELIAKIPTNAMSLGQIAYNPKADKFYVSNFDDGKIYIFANPPSGAAPVTSGFTTYDHGAGLATPIPDNLKQPFTAYGRRVWGLQYNAADNRLYYSVWKSDLRHPHGGDNEIWSVDLDASGNPVAGTARQRIDVLPYPGGLPVDNDAQNYDNEKSTFVAYSEPVSDIAFNDNGTVMLVAERGERIGRNIVGGYDWVIGSNSSLPHHARTLRYKLTGGAWVLDTPAIGEYNGDTDAGTTTSPSWHSNRTNSAGGVDFGYGYTTAAGKNMALDPSQPDAWAWTSTNSYETLSSGDHVYGMQGAKLATLPGAGAGTSLLTPPANLYFVDYDGDPYQSPKSMVGDVEVHRLPATAGGDSVLKICKVAGDGVEAGTEFTFSTTVPGTPDRSTTVPAGPGPGGWCKVAGTYATGSHVMVIESALGYVVPRIDIEPPAAGKSDTANKQADLQLGPGVTEVTFINELHTGYLEICKTGDVTGTYTFSVDGGGNVSVPAGACSPALQVTAGAVNITETTAGAVVANCYTLPASRQGACNKPGRVSTVTVVPGDISTQTIAYIENGECIETAADRCGKTNGDHPPPLPASQ